jgi:hypothetical protein
MKQDMKSEAQRKKVKVRRPRVTISLTEQEWKKRQAKYLSQQSS